MSTVFGALGWLMFGLNIAVMLVVFVLAVVGVIQVATTRDDAFMVVDRQKQNWLLLLGAAALLAALPVFAGIAMQMLWIIAAVIVGIYWQDVRPSIRDVLDNSGGVW